MPTLFKSAVAQPNHTATEVIYTMPALTTGLALSVLTTNVTDTSRTAYLGVQKSGSSTITPVINGLAIATGSSVNLLASKLSLDAGDRIVGSGVDATIGYRIRPGASPLPSVPTVILSNATGSIICAACGTSGIWTSTDGGVTYTQTLSGTTAMATGVYFLGAFHFYESATSKRTSTDGTTWSTVACTNAPQIRMTATGGVIVVGATAYSLFINMQLGSTTDGTTWAAFGVSIPSGIVNGLCWTGVRWVIASSTADTIYSSTNAAVWTAATGLATTLASIARGTANIGSRVVVNMGGALVVSVNDGQAFVNTNAAPSTTSGVVSAGTLFLTNAGSARELFSATGAIGSWVNPGNVSFDLTNDSVCVIPSSRIISHLHQSADLIGTRRGGVAMSVSVMEVS